MCKVSCDGLTVPKPIWRWWSGSELLLTQGFPVSASAFRPHIDTCLLFDANCIQWHVELLLLSCHLVTFGDIRLHVVIRLAHHEAPHPCRTPKRTQQMNSSTHGDGQVCKQPMQCISPRRSTLHTWMTWHLLPCRQGARQRAPSVCRQGAGGECYERQCCGGSFIVHVGVA